MTLPASERAIATMRRAGWLAGLDPALPAALAQAGRIARLSPGQWVHGEGDEETGLVVVIDGALQLYTRAPGDREVLVGHVEAGGTIGQSVRFGGGPRLVTAIAVVPAEALIVSDTALGRLAAAHPDIWRAVAALAYAQLRVTVQASAALVALPPAPRLAARLAGLGRGRRQPVVLTISQQALGELVGLTRKTVNGLLSEFERQGLVRRRYGRIELRDVRGLERLADG